MSLDLNNPHFSLLNFISHLMFDRFNKSPGLAHGDDMGNAMIIIPRIPPTEKVAIMQIVRPN